MAKNTIRKQNTKSAQRPKRKPPQFLRAKNENRLGMAAAMLAIMIMTGVVGVNSISLIQKEKAYAAKEQELLQQIQRRRRAPRSLRSLPRIPRQRNMRKK